MSSAAIATSPIEDLVASYRERRLSRAQIVAALVAAGATAGGAAVLLQAIESSPPPAQPVVSQGAHQQLTGIPAAHQAALHARHVALQAGR